LAVLAGLFSLALAPAPAQQPPAAEMGRIHGSVINPVGVPQKDGTVSLSTDGGETLSYNFPVSPAGEYSGQAPPGEYTVVYRAPDTPEGKIVDYISEVEVVAGQDTVPRQASARAAKAVAGGEGGQCRGFDGQRDAFFNQPEHRRRQCRPPDRKPGLP
jgi:hypothetical protein